MHIRAFAYTYIRRDEAFKYIKALSGVLRLGRAGASTDHSSVLFDVDISTGELKRGTLDLSKLSHIPSCV
jgi:hypothetical protein